MEHVCVEEGEGPGTRLIYCRNIPNGRDISNLCCHNCSFYGNQCKILVFSSKNWFCFSQALPLACCADAFLDARSCIGLLSSCYRLKIGVLFIPLDPFTTSLSPPPRALLPHFIERFLAPLLSFTLSMHISPHYSAWWCF